MIRESGNQNDIMSNQFFQSTLKQLVPNYSNIDKQVQKQICSILEQIISPVTPLITNQNMNKKKKLQQLSKLSMLEQAPLLRSHIWKLLLETLTYQPSTWATTRSQNSELYHALKNKFLTTYIDQEDLLDLGGSNFDRQLWDQIALDTKRTHSSLNFFPSQITTSKFGKVYASKPTRHCDMLNRILYIWAKTNGTIRYVQGMNEILAPFYYLEFQQLDYVNWDRQSQTFFMFASAMSFVIDMHIKEMDDCESGIMGRMISLNRFLRIVDGQLWQKMQDQGIFPQYYSFRWLALLLAQQFSLADTLKLWDTLLAYQGYKRFFYLYCLCIAILKLRKKQIMTSDFITSLPKIQRLKDISIDHVMGIGNKIYNEYKRRNFQKQFHKLMEKSENLKEKKKNEEIQIKQKSQQWTYAQLVKNTGTYLSKFNIWGKKQ